MSIENGGLLGFYYWFSLNRLCPLSLMPPRLLGNCREVGACIDSPYIDTMAEYGGLWSFDSGLMESLSNQYAAMPSLHFAWALWSWLAIRKHITTKFGRFAIASYPPLTLFAIVVTANHYWIDALGGSLSLESPTTLVFV